MNETDVTAVVSAYEAAGKPLAMFEAARTINPRPDNNDGRRREHKSWVHREMELIKAACDAHFLGYLEQVADPEYGPPFSFITNTGRIWLTHRKAT